jgi:hypothetical protein
MLTISASAVTPNEPTALNDVILKKNELSPYSGILISEPRYRQYTSAMLLSAHVEDCIKPSNSCDQDNSINSFIQIGGGFVLGISTLLIIQAIIQK